MENADMGINFVTPLPKGQTSKCISPATVTKCFSETEVVNRMDPWDNKINLNCKSLEFEFTDSPINKKKIAGGELSKSPWSQGLSHPKRDVMLTRKFSTWLAACVHDDLDREWIMHAVPRYVEVSGTDLKNMLCGRATMSYNLFDVAIRRLNQLDRLMHALKHLIHWRHIVESDFAMLVFAGEEVTANSSVRKQFIGEEVLHQIESCRMITIPALVRETWCAYFCDLKMKKFHVVDPLYKHEEHGRFDEVHQPNVCSLKLALSLCFIEFFEGWNPNIANFGISYVKPLTQNADNVDSGVLTLIVVRDFNGTDFSSLNGQDFIKCFKEQLLHELLSIRGNNANTPSNFVESIDLE
uniref:Uncharacterized protein n=1 Tax=Avena sativa TaxID=4498 RepID=A0ACD5YFQ3_AVESA